MQDDKILPSHRDYVSALASGLEIFKAFDSEHKCMTVSEVAERTGMDRAKSRRFLLTLHALGYVSREDKKFSLTPLVLTLGESYSASNGYLDVVQHYLQEVTTALGESCSLGILDNDEIIYLLRSSAAHRLMSINLTPGTRLPAAYTSMGRMLLSLQTTEQKNLWLMSVNLVKYTEHSIVDKDVFITLLNTIKNNGYCLVDQELELGLRSLAVPVFSGKGKLIGAINISTNASRVSESTLISEALPILMKAATQINAHTM